MPKRRGFITTTILISLFILFIISLVYFFTIKSGNNKNVDDGNIDYVPEPPNPLNESWAFVPEIETPPSDGYCQNLYLRPEDPDPDCHLCQTKIDQAKEKGKDDNEEFEPCPYMDVKNCRSCYFKAVLEHDVSKCGGEWVITTTDPCGEK